MHYLHRALKTETIEVKIKVDRTEGRMRIRGKATEPFVFLNGFFLGPSFDGSKRCLENV